MATLVSAVFVFLAGAAMTAGSNRLYSSSPQIPAGVSQTLAEMTSGPRLGP